MINIPLSLTFIRLIIAPLFVPLLCVCFLPFNTIYVNGLVALLFVFFGITDFFDGYLARRFGQETFLGKLLDPLADKFLMASTLIALLAIHKIYFLWVIIFIVREFFVMGLREVALSQGFSITVSWGGKIKTCVHMAYIFFVILNPYQAQSFFHPWNLIEDFLLVGALCATLISAFYYYSYFIKNYYHIPA